jgi:N-formylglutamate amidohydrolase
MPEREIASIRAELDPPIAVLRPLQQAAPIVLSSPHSGRVYPRAFVSAARLTGLALRSSEDCYVDELVTPAAMLGAPLVAARFPRAYLDVNREPYELDPEVIQGRIPDYANTRSIRVVGGLGTIARIVSEQEEIYREKVPVEVALARIDLLYRPYHTALADLLEATRRRFGIAVLLDCHSMPSGSMGQPGGGRPDFVLGDRFGVACDGRLLRLLRETLAGMGYDVQLNRPYAGGFITEHYGRPAQGLHAIQIEINRGLYLDERTLERTAGFARLAGDLRRTMETLVAEVPRLLASRASAAE